MSGLYLPSEEDFDFQIDDFFSSILTKERKYKHFDLPLNENKRTLKISLNSEDTVHRFLPLLGYTDTIRKVKKTEAGKRYQSVKTRPIRFASHNDAAYLEAYGNLLSEIYEDSLKLDGTSEVVLAYRKGGATNIHHAKSLFDEIKERKNCCVFALDISGFFDCLDHDHLRYELARLAKVQRLNGHHWTAFKNITKYSWVETSDLNLLLSKKRNRLGRVCTPEDFKKHVQGRKNGLVRKNIFDYGIPQGTPVSGLYANIYMRSFDRELLTLANQYNGSYRRYSDDIAIVLPNGAKVIHVVAVVEKILADYKLSISTGKTEMASFSKKLLSSDKPIQYLGFTFDGTETLIRESSLTAYRGKTRRGIHAKLVAAKKKGILSREVYRREALSKYTHVGKRRNFLKYAYKASDIMNAPEIKKQVKNHMTWFKREWESQINDVYS